MQWRDLTDAVLDGDRARFQEITIEGGFVSDPDAFDFRYQYAAHRLLLEPYSASSSYAFNRHFVKQAWAALVVENRNLSRTNMPADWVLSNRVQWGLYSVLADLEAESNWCEYQRILAER